MDYKNVNRPTMVLDKAICLKNIDRMIAKAKRNNVIFRPHFKTHQSAKVGDFFAKKGVDKITVSSLDMALYFADAGWKDITVAFPVNILEIDKICDLASKIKLNLILSSAEMVSMLYQKLMDSIGSRNVKNNSVPKNEVKESSTTKTKFYPKNSLGIFIKVDVGYHRVGIDVNDYSGIQKIIDELAKYDILKFKGFLTHAGHTYDCKNSDEILNIYKDSMSSLKKLKQHFIPHYPNIIISYGDTPSVSLAEDFKDVDELRPGNFVFYDLMQWSLGVCAMSDIALRVSCPIVEVHNERNQFVIYGGGVHFSKEFLQDSNDRKYYGIVKAINCKELANNDIRVFSLSQEHGEVSFPNEYINKFHVGDIVSILPIHACMTVNELKEYIIV